MKFTKTIFGAVLTVALLAITVCADPVEPGGYTIFSRGTTNGATALSSVIIGANSANAGTPVVTSISAVSDKALALVQFYRVTGETAVTATNSATSLYVTAGGVDSGVIIIRHLINDRYEKRTLTTSTNVLGLVLTVAPQQSAIPGDVVYFATSTGSGALALSTNNVPFGSTMALNVSGSALFSGQKGKPLLAEVDGTSSATLHSITARFEP